MDNLDYLSGAALSGAALGFEIDGANICFYLKIRKIGPNLANHVVQYPKNDGAIAPLAPP